MSITVLFGSGVSIPAGMPSVKCIDNLLRNDERIHRRTDGKFYLSEKANDNKGIVKACRSIYQTIDKFIHDADQNAPASVDYEQLYFYLDTLFRSYSVVGDDYSSLYVYKKILEEELNLIRSKFLTFYSSTNNLELLNYAINLIIDIVKISLDRNPDKIDYLENLLKNLCDLGVSHVFTLNHDKLLETSLKVLNSSFNDGFDEPANGVRYWKSALYDQPHIIHLYKLHGSIDWTMLRPEEGVDQVDRIGIVVDGDIWHAKTPDGRSMDPVVSQPLLLCGTGNKQARYADDIFLELHYRFMKRLEESKYLFVCGYGFRDKGINDRIINWAESHPEKRLVIAHQEPENLLKYARPAISRCWKERWEDQGKVKTIKKMAQDITNDDLKEHLV